MLICFMFCLPFFTAASLLSFLQFTLTLVVLGQFVQLFMLREEEAGQEFATHLTSETSKLKLGMDDHHNN